MCPDRGKIMTIIIVRVISTAINFKLIALIVKTPIYSLAGTIAVREEGALFSNFRHFINQNFHSTIFLSISLIKRGIIQSRNHPP
jgi:hypothetical protein